MLLTENRTPLFQNMQKLIALLIYAKRPQLMPNSVLQTAKPPGFHPGHEQDSSEFLEHLLDRLNEQELLIIQNARPVICAESMIIDNEQFIGNSSSSSKELRAGNIQNTLTTTENNDLMPGTLIQNSFGGNISITHKCLICTAESKQYDSFRDLHLSFPDKCIIDPNVYHSVQNMLDFYCSTERLDQDNKYYCEQCKTLCDGERLINIVSAPQYLILTLKHFKYDQKYNLRAKLLHKVCYEELVNIKVMPNNEAGLEYTQSYQLYAAVVHSGVSMESGHYFTYASDHCGWYKFDDSYVAKCSVSELHELQPPHTPYILFYKMIQPNVMMASGNTSIIDPNYPELADLPLHLSEYVHFDNISYAKEMRSSQPIIRTLNGNNDTYRSDDNDEPPSSCGGNFAPSYNRFIS